MTQEISVIDFRALTEKQFAALRTLKVSDRQEVLGKSFLESIEDWESEPKDRVLGLCFVIEEMPVGLTLFRKHSPPLDHKVSIHGLKIAIPWQGRGYGHQAFLLAFRYLKSEWPEARILTLAVDAENSPAIAIYRAIGMSDSGPAFEGPNGKEHHMEMRLEN
ncbi:GNAT family N-acetyltransferase [Jannaschia pohangensis]|uniref:Protein N-acetyltransferase, RimJ/RimL family n=1 Tax=Jannaschia pohangensis TaxID=390807 RepID=A0A1I3GRW3_9RHOB|nr:GNAT family protein [Jannaschia pohangensis]SFI26150.1 Protein N-acetyltransferase, RimJ/RimL family [Jannaschia pohangensis]